jgi:pyrimidine/purine-5'-nucleotide nucleosidase
LVNKAPDNYWEMGPAEILSPDTPETLRLQGGHPFADMYQTSLLVHEELLGNGGGPVLSGDFLRILADRLNMLPTTPSVTFMGGGRLPGGVNGIEYQHCLNVAGEIAALLGEMTASTGSGPGAMAAAHEGTEQAINGGATNFGVTMEPLVKIEIPGPHNHRLGVVKLMPRRLEFLLRLAMGVVNLRGGVGSLQEEAVEAATVLDERNKEMDWPIIFSEPHTGNDTPMMDLMRLFEAIAGPEALSRKIILQQGTNYEPLSVLKKLKGDSNGFWNRDIALPEQAFRPSQLNPAFIKSIDLRDPRDVPSRTFSELSHLAFYVVQTFLNPEYVRENGAAQIKIARSLHSPLVKVLRGFWEQGRVKSKLSLDDVINFQLV